MQERAFTTHTVLTQLNEVADAGSGAAELLGALREALAPEIKPVAPHAQRKVKMPKVLLEWDPAELGDDTEDDDDRDGEASRAADGIQASPGPGTTASPAESTPDATTTPRRPPPQSPYYLSESSACATGTDSAALDTPSCQRRSSDASADDLLAAEPAAPSHEGSLPGAAAAGVLQPHEWQDDAVAEVNMDEDEPSETDDAEAADNPSAGTPLASAAATAPSYGSSQRGAAAEPTLIDF